MVTIVDACVRDGRGGSPTAVVVDDGTMTDEQRRLVPVQAGTSHAAFLGATHPGGGQAVRFFTRSGELAGCGHGTIAAQAVLLAAAGLDRRESRQHTGGRTFDTVAVRHNKGIEVWFDQGTVTVRPATEDEYGPALPALGIGYPAGGVVSASPGTPRLLVPVASREELLSLTPDYEALTVHTRRIGHLGCYVYVAPDAGPAAARMFAPAIGVPEDLANANSAGCLAAHLYLGGGTPTVEVEQGESIVFASAHSGPSGVEARIGGIAIIR